FWMPHLMWRFDKNWKAQRSETPWVTEPPSHYLGRSVFLTTYPLEAPPDPADLRRGLEMVRAETQVLFSGNYPHWELGDPFEMIEPMPDALRRRVLVDNALAVYGPRLLAPNR